MRNINRNGIVCSLGIVLTSVIVASGATANHLTPEEKTAGWTLLFDGQTSAGWHSFKKKTFPQKGWEVSEGWLHCLGKGGGDLISDGEFENFELSWEWKQASGGNSGLKYFVLESRPSAIGHEYQMIDDERHEDAKVAGGKHATATFYDVLKTTAPVPTKQPGEINLSRVMVKGNHVEHWLNGAKVLDYECGSDAVKAAVAKSKFKNTAGFGDKAKAHLLLQDHNSEAWFRNIKLRPLPVD
jgi:hypothetical protein